MIKNTLLILMGVLLIVLNFSPLEAQQKRKKQELVAELDSISSAHAAHPSVAGISVAVVQEDDTLLHKGYGKAHLDLDVAVSRNHNFEIGSVTKQFTATAILQLVSKDSMQLDASISEYLPEFNTRGHTITVRQLLYHTSGIQGYLTLPFAPHVMSDPIFGDPVPKDSILTVIERMPLRFAPGSVMTYSNTGYFLLGLMIEQVSGLSFKKYIETNILQPAGMDHSYICSDNAIKKREAQGYIWLEGPGIQNRPTPLLKPKWEIGMSGLCSTSGDLAHWTQALHRGEVLPDSMYEEMMTPGRLVDGTELRYAMGVGYRNAGGHQSIQHSGSMAGFLSNLRYYPGSELVISVLQNTSGIPNPTNIPKTDVALGNTLAHTVLGEGEERQSTRYRGDLSKFTGQYSGPDAASVRTLEVRVEDGGLVVSSPGSNQQTQLIHLSGLTWRPDRESGDDRYIFIKKGDEIAELRIDRVHKYLILHRIN